MRITNYTDFRSKMAAFLKAAVNEDELLVITRASGKHVVVISLEKYTRLVNAANGGTNK